VHPCGEQFNKGNKNLIPMNINWSLSLISDMDETGGQLTDVSVRVLDDGRKHTNSHLGDQGESRVKSSWALWWKNWHWDRCFICSGLPSQHCSIGASFSLIRLSPTPYNFDI
jgi:hypothetical protein